MLKSVDRDSMSGEPIGTTSRVSITSGKSEILCAEHSLQVFSLE
jgi:hypothetical protein